ncbi:hypothetical protein [Trueperella sp.]|uniref:hypothetical protein n=1 Tax=Trueperella sp. TaxID=2699835 RepID=UPI0037364015
MVGIEIFLFFFATGPDSDEITGSWEASTSGSTVTIVSEYSEEPVGRNPVSNPGGGGGRTGVPVAQPVEPPKTGILAELEGLTADQMCDQYFGTYSSSGAGYFEGAQFSGPLAEYCLNRTATEPGDAAAAPAVMTVADLGIYIRENAQTIIASGVLTLEPGSGEVVINKDVYFASSARPYTANVTVLNTPLELQFHPTAFTWDLGDGTQFTTAGPGGPYPDGDARGQYTRPGTYTPAVHISWDVSIRFAGTANWYNVPGDAFTDTIGQPVTAVEAEAVLTANR